MCWESRLRRFGSFIKANIVFVSPRVFYQEAQAVFLAYPRNCDVYSHPLITWRRGNARDFIGRSWVQRSWMGISRIFLPLPKHIQSPGRPSVEKKGTARTSISLPMVRTWAFLWFCATACARWRNILVSASLWLQDGPLSYWMICWTKHSHLRCWEVFSHPDQTWPSLLVVLISRNPLFIPCFGVRIRSTWVDLIHGVDVWVIWISSGQLSNVASTQETVWLNCDFINGIICWVTVDKCVCRWFKHYTDNCCCIQNTHIIVSNLSWTDRLGGVLMHSKISDLFVFCGQWYAKLGGSLWFLQRKTRSYQHLVVADVRGRDFW